DLEAGFIHGTVFMVNGVRPVNTACLDSFVQKNPDAPCLIERSGHMLIRSGSEESQCELLKQPQCTREALANGMTVGSFGRLHSPSTLFVTSVRECVFGYLGQTCQFCTFESERPRPLAPSMVLDIAQRFKRDLGHSFDVALGSGTP